MGSAQFMGLKSDPTFIRLHPYYRTGAKESIMVKLTSHVGRHTYERTSHWNTSTTKF